MFSWLVILLLLSVVITNVKIYILPWMKISEKIPSSITLHYTDYSQVLSRKVCILQWRLCIWDSAIIAVYSSIIFIILESVVNLLAVHCWITYKLFSGDCSTLHAVSSLCVNRELFWIHQRFSGSSIAHSMTTYHLHSRHSMSPVHIYTALMLYFIHCRHYAPVILTSGYRTMCGQYLVYLLR